MEINNQYDFFKNILLDTDGSLVVNASGSGVAPQEFIFVSTKSDLPSPVGGVITLEDNYTYYFTTDVDLTGDKLVGGFNTTILGASSENASITSTGLAVGVPLLTTEWTTPVRHITFKDVDTALHIEGTTNPPVALDWTGVNFLNVPNVGVIDTCDNFIFDKGSFLTAKGLIFSGSVGTIAVGNSLLRGDSASGSLITIASDATVTRRFRTTYSSINTPGSTTGIYVHPSASIPTEGFILDTVSFSGASQDIYLPGLNHISNDSLFINCTGIINTAVNGQLYMQNNTTVTDVVTQNVFVKVSGSTLNSVDNSKYTGTDNRLTCNATIQRKYKISCTLNFSGQSGDVYQFGFYDSKLGAVRTPSRTKSTANAAGKAENIHIECVVQHSNGDYLEIHGSNTSANRDFTVTDMNFLITEIK